MEVANVRVRLNKVGSDVPVTGVTPAEAMFLHILHGPYNGGSTFGEDFTKIEIVGTAMVDTGKMKKVVDQKAVPAKIAVGTPGQPGYQPPVEAVAEVSHEERELRPRTAAEERRRLAGKYNQARTKDNKPIIDQVWPDKLNPKLPETFAEIEWANLDATLTGIETAAVNYATGDIAKTSL